MKLTLSGSQIQILIDRDFFLYDGEWTKEKMFEWNIYPDYDRSITVGFGRRYIWDNIDIEVAKNMARYFETLFGATEDPDDYKYSVSAYKSIHKQITKVEGE
jgi:hypothetical protein